MKNKTIQSLQNVYKLLGGNIDNVLNINNIPDMILAISSLETNSTDNISLLSTALEEETEDNQEIVSALKNLYTSYGGDISDVEDITTIADMIDKIIDAKTIYKFLNIQIQPENSDTVLYGVEVDTYQVYVSFYGCTFTGLFEFVENGLTNSGRLSGDGYFLAIKFDNISDFDIIKAGVGTIDSDVELITIENNSEVFKFTDFTTERLVIEVTKNNISRRLYFYNVEVISGV